MHMYLLPIAFVSVCLLSVVTNVRQKQTGHFLCRQTTFDKVDPLDSPITPVQIRAKLFALKQTFATNFTISSVQMNSHLILV